MVRGLAVRVRSAETDERQHGHHDHDETNEIDDGRHDKALLFDDAML